jgi:hypothetical protein
MNNTENPSGQPGAARQGEQGVALLMTLGVVALILVLAMSFSFTSRTDRMAAINNADTTKARLLAESGLERVLAGLKLNYDGTNAGDTYPATESGFSVINNRHISLSSGSTDTVTDELVTDLGGMEFLSSSDTSAAKWIHVEDPTDSSKIIGRIAFAIVDESGKIDPNGVLTPEHEPFDDTNDDNIHDSDEPYSDINGNGSYDAATIYEGNEVRSGNSPQEINLGNVLPSSVTPTSDFVDNMPSTLKKWFSWEQLFKAGITGLDDSTAPTCLARISPHSYDIEAWWNDDDTDTVWDAGEDKQRYNLNNLATASVTALTSSTATEFWDRTDPDSWEINTTTATSIPWLASMTKEDGTTSVANQVAANLIDYCDSDDSATTNYSPYTSTNWDTSIDWNGTITMPSADYVGLEKVPYINEVRFMAHLSDKQLILEVWVELINIYDEDLDNWDGLRVDVGFPNNVGNGNTSPNKGYGYTFTSWTSNPPGTTVPAKGYQKTGSSATFTWNGTGGNAFNLNINNLAVTLYSSGKVADFALIADSASSSNPAPNTWAMSIGPNETTYCNVEVGDPRQNSQPSSWHWEPGSFNSSSIVAGTSMIVGTVLGSNTACDPDMSNPSSPSLIGYTPDTETISALKNTSLSTAYIRNAPMESLWELGAIHRGEAWRTINLHSYDTSQTEGTYDYGDWPILDQVRLSSKSEAQGKVNVNTPITKVAESIFAGINQGDDGYDDLENGSAVDHASLATSLLSATATPFTSRAQIASVADLSSGGSTDRSQEEIIGKIANLLTVRQNYFTVIVVGQAVKDLPGISPTAAQKIAHPEWQEYDTSNNNWCSVLGEQKIMAVVYRDALANTYKIQRWEYLDD